MVIRVESIEFDKVDDKVFELPPEIKALLVAKPKQEKPTQP